jgi:hypothetical protein
MHPWFTDLREQDPELD